MKDLSVELGGRGNKIGARLNTFFYVLPPGDGVNENLERSRIRVLDS